MAARCGSGHCPRVVRRPPPRLTENATRCRAVTLARQWPRRRLSVTGSMPAWAQCAVSPSSAPGVALLAVGLVGELVSGASKARLVTGCLLAHTGPGRPGGQRLGLRVMGSQPLVARNRGERRAVGHVATSGGWRTRFGSWGRRRWVVVIALLVLIAVAIVLIVLYAGGGSGGGVY
jgi:hypothetical protein